MNSSSRYKDSFNDIGFITIIGNAFHDLACTLNYNITVNMSSKKKTINCITPTFNNRHRSINAEKILNSQNVETFFINFNCLTECLIELISDNENNLLLFRITQQNALNQLVIEDKLRENVLKIYHIIISYCFSKIDKSNIDNSINSEEGISPEYLKLIELLQLRQYPAEFKIDVLYEINELNIECDQAKNIFKEAGGYICILSLLSELGGIWSNKSSTKSSKPESDACLTPVIKRDISLDRLSISSINDYINGANQLDSINDYIKQSFVMKKLKIKKDDTNEVDKHTSSFVLFQLILTSLIISLKNMPMNRRFFSKNFDKKSFSDLLYMTGIFNTNAGFIIYGYLFALLTEDLSIVDIFCQNNQKLKDIQDTDEQSDDDKPIMIVRSKSDYFDNWNDKTTKNVDKDDYNTFKYYSFSSSTDTDKFNLIVHDNKEKLSKLKFINSYGIPVVLDILQNSMDPNITYTILEIINVLLNSYKYNQIMAYKTKTLLSSLIHILYSSDSKSKYPLKQLQYLTPTDNKEIITDPSTLGLWDKCFENIHSLSKLVIENGIEDYDSLFLLEKYNELSLKCTEYLEITETENEELQKVKSSILDLMTHALKIKSNSSYIHFDLTLDSNSYISLKHLSDGLFPTNNGYSVIVNFRICQFNTSKTLNIVDIVDTKTNNSILTLSINKSNNLKRLYIKTNKTQACIDNLMLMENKWYEIIITHQPNKYLRTLSFTGSSLNMYINGEFYDNIKNDYIDTPISTQHLQCKIGEVVKSITNNKNEVTDNELTTHVKWDFGVCYLINNALESSVSQKIFLPTVDIQTIKFSEEKILISLCSKNVVDNVSEFKDEGINKYYRLILNNTKYLNGITYKNLASINEENISQFGIIKGAYCEYNPNLFSNSIWRFGGMSILLKIMENENVIILNFILYIYIYIYIFHMN